MSKKDLDLSKYTGDAVDLIGLNTEFKLCHIPFIVENDVKGALALQGSSGTGKTTIATKLGMLNELATGETWGIYSADKARYEDFVGCPIPDLDKGNMKIYPMPNSITTKSLILVDEINRANYENQEKWLSLIASREVDGHKAKTRYIFAAMNPVMSDNKEDIYEGTQPIDKALGERMIGLIDIPGLGKIKDADLRRRILKSAINQNSWKPTDELVELHTAFIARAREIYNEAKVDYIEQVAEYVDSVQKELRDQTKEAIAIEARRAQFILVNILAVYALDAVVQGTGPNTLKQAAQTALLSSFPNTLWEQRINNVQLNQVHKEAADCLTIDLATLKSGAVSNNDLTKAINAISEAAAKKVDKEQLSKIIFTGIPPREGNAFSHIAYLLGVRQGLINRADRSSDTQNIMKAQEYSRFDKYYKSLIQSESYKKYEKLGKALKTDKNKKDYIVRLYPTFLSDGIQTEPDFGSFVSILESDASWLVMAAIEEEKLDLKTYQEFFAFMCSTLEAQSEITKVRAQYEEGRKN